MSCTTADALDRQFAMAISKIERSYGVLSKQERVRVEKWVDKLVTSCGGPYLAWKRDRNEYIEYLLHAVSVSKRLTDPFQRAPPDGLLPRFPSHVRAYSPSRQHIKSNPNNCTTRFWKEIYQQMSLPAAEPIMPAPAGKSEQQRLISYLTQTLRDEKLKHCLQLQQLANIHKAEIISMGNQSSYMGAHSFRYNPEEAAAPAPSSSAAFHEPSESLYQRQYTRRADSSGNNNNTSASYLQSSLSSPARHSNTTTRTSRDESPHSAILCAAKAAALLAATGIEDALAAIAVLEREETEGGERYRYSPERSSPQTGHRQSPMHHQYQSSPEDKPSHSRTGSQSTHAHVTFSPLPSDQAPSSSASPTIDSYHSPLRTGYVSGREVRKDLFGSNRVASSPSEGGVGDDHGTRAGTDAGAEMSFHYSNIISTTNNNTNNNINTNRDSNSRSGGVGGGMADSAFLPYMDRFQGDLRRLKDTPIDVATPPCKSSSGTSAGRILSHSDSI